MNLDDGMSFTNFKYDNLKVQKDTFLNDESIQISVDVTNTGKRSGKEVVQLYSADLVASIVPAVKQLRRFQKMEIAPGETKKVDFTLTEKDLAFVNRENQWITEEGEFAIMVDTLAMIFYLQK